jgi:cytosine/adenosine deaminase-related metal-dependent hydrolase
MYLVFKNVNLIHSKSKNQLEFLKNHNLIVHKPSGKIVEIAKDGDVLKTVLHETSTEYISLPPSHFIIPGLVDTHTHAPQYFLF